MVAWNEMDDGDRMVHLDHHSCILGEMAREGVRSSIDEESMVPVRGALDQNPNNQGMGVPRNSSPWRPVYREDSGRLYKVKHHRGYQSCPARRASADCHPDVPDPEAHILHMKA